MSVKGTISPRKTELSDFKQVEKRVEKVDPLQYLSVADRLLEARQYKDALKYYDQILSSGGLETKTRRDILFKAAKICFFLGDTDKHQEYLETARKIRDLSPIPFSPVGKESPSKMLQSKKDWAGNVETQLIFLEKLLVEKNDEMIGKIGNTLSKKLEGTFSYQRVRFYLIKYKVLTRIARENPKIAPRYYNYALAALNKACDILEKTPKTKLHDTYREEIQLKHTEVILNLGKLSTKKIKKD